MSPQEEAKLSKIISLQTLVESNEIKELIAEDLKDEDWLEETLILIQACNKRILKSEVLKEHINQCKNFIVFRYIEDKLIYTKELVVSKNPWEFKEVSPLNEKNQWINSKFHKYFLDSYMPEILNDMIKEKELVIDTEWIYKNKSIFFNEEIFEDIDFILKKKFKF